MLLFLPLIFIILIPAVNIIFYSVFKKKYGLKIDVFLYGVGFIQVPMALLFVFHFTSVAFGESVGIAPIMWTLFIIPLASFFYSFSLFKNNGKSVGKIVLCLLAANIVFFALVIIKNVNLLFPFYLLGMCLPILGGLYAGYYAAYRTVRPSLRNLAWTPMLVLLSAIFILFIPGGVIALFLGISSAIIDWIESITAISTVMSIILLILFFITAFISIFIIPFFVAFLIGTVHKHFIKKKGHAEPPNTLDSNHEDTDLIKNEGHDETPNTLDSTHDDTDLIKSESHDETPNTLDSNHDGITEK